VQFSSHLELGLPWSNDKPASRPRRPMSAFGPKRTSLFAPHMSAFGGKADIDRYGNRMLRRASCGSELRMNDYPVVEPSTPSPRNEMLRDVAIVFGCNLQNF